MRIFFWHVHGSWSTAFVQGGHEYVVPVTPDRGPDGLGRARTYPWPDNVSEVPVDRLADVDVDAIVLQRPHEVQLCRQWLGRRPGRDVPAVYVEHNTPGSAAVNTRHPLADQREIPLVHVTHLNRLMWDNGAAPTTVIEHGIVDPGYRFTGDVPAAAVVVNDPVRRGRAVGTDLLPELSAAVPVDVFGMGVDLLPEAVDVPAHRCRTYPDLPQHAMHPELARRRVYVHTHRWTSLGLSLLEAMHLGMPVVALACTEVPRAVPAEAGCVTADTAELYDAARRYTADVDAARTAGLAAREAALQRYGLRRFRTDWDRLLRDITGIGAAPATVPSARRSPSPTPG